MKTEPNEPISYSHRVSRYDSKDIIHQGLTKREYAAIHIMAGLDPNKYASSVWMALDAVEKADHLFNQLNVNK